MIQTFFEIFFNFVYNVFVSLKSSIFFNIYLSNYFVFYESTANLNKFFLLFFSMFAY